MEIELLSRETIKPSSPTPSHLKVYPLSFLDNIFFNKYVPLILFYNSNDGSYQNSKTTQLRKSLSQVLSKYYHFAGRLKDRIFIECNDQGVSFLVANIKNKLSEIFQNPTEKLLCPLFPDELQWKDMDWSETLIAIQINCFSCGGMAISICMSHKVGDAATLFNFMSDWAIINQKSEKEEKRLLISPFSLLEGGSSIFPQRNIPIFPELAIFKGNNVVCKRFVFQPSMIKSLKEIVYSKFSKSMHYPSRVQVVTALIYKCAVLAMGLNFKTASFSMLVDLRKRMVPPLSEKCVGNMVWFSPFLVDKKEMELHDLVWKIKEGISDFCNVYPKKFGGKEKHDLTFISECLEKINEPNTEDNNLFNFSSWCGFPIYEIDFGWGKPTWVTSFGCFMRNAIFMMDTRDGNGIEALVSMEQNHMVMFENDVELLQYASVNPSIA